MPSVSAHMVVAYEVGKKLNLTSDDYLRGNLLPDILDKKVSHYRIKGNIYKIPNIKYFLENFDMNNDLNIGYLVHLLLDKYYVGNYLEKYYFNEDVFINNMIYDDYDYINNKLINEFNLNIEELERILSKKYNMDIINENLEYNLKCLKNKRVGIPKYLEFNNFKKFLLDISNTIYEDIINYKNN